MDLNENLTNELEGIIDTEWLQRNLPDSLGEKISLPSRREERILEKQAKKKASLRNRKPYTRKPGHVHPKKKVATAKRRYAAKWSTNPFGCFIHGFGAYAVDRKEWDRLIMPFWLLYEAADMSIARYGKPWGSRVKPHSVYSFDLVHKNLGTIYCGASQELYDLSKPSSL